MGKARCVHIHLHPCLFSIIPMPLLNNKSCAAKKCCQSGTVFVAIPTSESEDSEYEGSEPDVEGDIEALESLLTSASLHTSGERQNLPKKLKFFPKSKRGQTVHQTHKQLVGERLLCGRMLQKEVKTLAASLWVSIHCQAEWKTHTQCSQWPRNQCMTSTWWKSQHLIIPRSPSCSQSIRVSWSLGLTLQSGMTLRGHS